MVNDVTLQLGGHGVQVVDQVASLLCHVRKDLGRFLMDSANVRLTISTMWSYLFKFIFLDHSRSFIKPHSSAFTQQPWRFFPSTPAAYNDNFRLLFCRRIHMRGY